MDAFYPVDDLPATPEYVLAVFRDLQRQLSLIGPEEDDGRSWTLQITVEEWFMYSDWHDWRVIARALNQEWEIQCSDAEWQAALEPADQKRLGDVCELIARHARRPVVRPARLFGCSCQSAGAFLTVRSLLREAGATEEEITPATLLAPYTRRYCELFLVRISRLSPGALPPIRMRKPIYDIGLVGSLVGMMICMMGACSGMPLLLVPGVGVLVVAFALTWIAARWMLPASVEFGDLRTFRDLAIALAEGPADPFAPADHGGGKGVGSWSR